MLYKGQDKRYFRILVGSSRIFVDSLRILVGSLRILVDSSRIFVGSLRILVDSCLCNLLGVSGLEGPKTY